MRGGRAANDGVPSRELVCGHRARSPPPTPFPLPRRGEIGGTVRICLPELLNVTAMDQSGNMQNRRSRRAPVLLAASVEVRGVATAVKLRNLSAQGALIEGEKLPAEGAVTVFTRKELQLPCEVMWVEGHYAGIRFARELEREEVLRYIPK